MRPSSDHYSIPHRMEPRTGFGPASPPSGGHPPEGEEPTAEGALVKLPWHGG